MKKWFYDAETHFFHGFYQVSDSTDTIYTAGPFDTLKEAKEDAIARFKTDIAYAKDAISEIRSWTKQKEKE